ncbi:hypothetical protein EPK33_15165 [Enterococcus faecalis]|nr:hypothetical protein [Enterococcus faecalis]EGO8495113.1 hypothetical protein [Enterococcus faecalis]PQD23347.1 hypothetical protein CUM75_10280 [Enterococcus faecalis]PQD34657.1 hypothetical protein CUM64_03885 [Enterococcus faecalis]TKN26354.1 hypothetical protein DVW82_02170 [Enterococcus faecalis]
MKFLVQMMYIMLLVFPWLPLLAVSYFSDKSFKIQKSFFEFIKPQSENDDARLLINFSIFLFSIWCILFFLISLLENV